MELKLRVLFWVFFLSNFNELAWNIVADDSLNLNLSLSEFLIVFIGLESMSTAKVENNQRSFDFFVLLYDQIEIPRFHSRTHIPLNVVMGLIGWSVSIDISSELTGNALLGFWNNCAHCFHKSILYEIIKKRWH